MGKKQLKEEKFQIAHEPTARFDSKMHELGRSQDRYYKMIAEVEDYAIILLDTDGIIQNWNKGAEQIKQYTEKEIVGKSFHIFYRPEDRANHLPERLLAKAATEGKAIHEGWRLRKDGSKFWGSITLTALHDTDNNVIGFSKVTRDLTELKLAEEVLQKKNEELRKSEERYHQMIAEVQDYAIILLNEEGVIQNWNLGAEKIKGYSAEEIIGKSFKIFYPTKDRENKLPDSLLEEARINGRAIHEGWRVRKDGTNFWGSVTITVLHGTDGQIIGFSKVTRDLTERKKAEDKLQEYLADLENRNRELEQFAYITSHDLQEPLRKILTFSDIIQRNFDDKVVVEKFLKKINSSSQRMSDLIKSVLDYSKLSSGRNARVETDLNRVLENVKSDLELLIEDKKAVIESTVLPVIKAIPVQMNQLFTNLIGNGLKFCIENPIIKIQSKTVSFDQVVNIPEGVKGKKFLQISFADNGIGFEQEYDKLIFNIFQRLHEKTEFSGTGIGLALCKKIMEGHDGFITAQSEPSKGATFYTYFPLEE